MPVMKVVMVSDGWVKDADRVDGFDASRTPTANTILPLNANGRIYDYVVKGSTGFDPTDFTMSNGTSYLIGSVNITTPSWSPSGAWKVIFVVKSYFASAAAGVNTFVQRVKYDTITLEGGFWFWNAPGPGNGIGIADTFLVSDLSNGVAKTFNFYVAQGGGSANATFQSMGVDWYLIPA